MGNIVLINDNYFGRSSSGNGHVKRDPQFPSTGQSMASLEEECFRAVGRDLPGDRGRSRRPGRQPRAAGAERSDAP